MTLSVLMLKRDLSWSDDWAGYIMQAQALLGGNMREFLAQNSFTLENSSYVFAPVTYPWGLPVLLAPVLALFGLKILALKFALSVCYALFLPVFFLLARTRLTEAYALLLTAVLGLNPAILLIQNELYADIPFLLFSTLALWLIEKFVNHESAPRLSIGAAVAIGCVIFLAIFMRAEWFRPADTTGNRASSCSSWAVIANIAACTRWISWPAFRMRRWGSSTWRRRLSFRVSHTRCANSWPGYPLRTSGRMSGTTSGCRPNCSGACSVEGRVLYLLLLLGFLLNLARWRRRDLPIHAYGATTLLFYVIYPPVQGLRYILPLLPLLAILSLEGMTHAVGRLSGPIESGPRC